MPDFGGFFRTLNTDFLFLPAGTDQTSETTRNTQDAIVRRQMREGVVGPVEAAELLGKIQNADLNETFREPGNSPTAEFIAEVGNGVKNLPGTVNKSLGGLFNGVLGSVPWQAWAVLGVVVVVYLWPTVLGPLAARFAKGK